MPQLGEDERVEVNYSALHSGSAGKRRQVFLPVLLLCIALFVAWRYRDYLFSANGSGEATLSPAAAQGEQKAAPVASHRNKGKQSVGSSASGASDGQMGMTAVVTERVVRMPLQVDVMYGSGLHQVLRTRDDSIHLPVAQDSSAAATDNPGEADAGASNTSASNAVEQVRLSPEAMEVVSHPVAPSYPQLAQQMNVQGSVILQVKIGKDGNIQDLQVLSGPGILAEAAREAVKQWRFKPYYLGSQPVETQTRVTVNFSISTHQ